jgi:hypothetical protein
MGLAVATASINVAAAVLEITTVLIFVTKVELCDHLLYNVIVVLKKARRSALTLNNIAGIHDRRGEYEEAMMKYNQSLEMEKRSIKMKAREVLYGYGITRDNIHRLPATSSKQK